MPCSRTGVSTRASLRVCSRTEPQPPTTPLSSTLTTSRCSRGELDQGGVDRLDPARVDHGDADALRGEPLGDLDAGRRHRADGDEQHVRRALRGRARRRRRARSTASMSASGGPLGKRTTVGASSTCDRLAQQLAQPGGVARGGEPQPGHDLEDRHVPHAVVGGAVVAGDAGAVEHEGDAAAVQGHVHEHLVEGPVEERRVDGDDRVQPAHRQPGRGGGGVLLGDADVEGAVGEALRRRGSARRGAASPR